jgi:hypothetical protein
VSRPPPTIPVDASRAAAARMRPAGAARLQARHNLRRESAQGEARGLVERTVKTTPPAIISLPPEMVERSVEERKASYKSPPESKFEVEVYLELGASRPPSSFTAKADMKLDADRATVHKTVDGQNQVAVAYSEGVKVTIRMRSCGRRRNKSSWTSSASSASTG